MFNAQPTGAGREADKQTDTRAHAHTLSLSLSRTRTQSHIHIHLHEDAVVQRKRRVGGSTVLGGIHCYCLCLFQTHRFTQIHRQTDRQTDRQTHTHTHTHTHYITVRGKYNLQKHEAVGQPPQNMDLSDFRTERGN